MSTLRDPVGPKDRKVYVRRRLLVLAGLIAVIVAIVLIIVKPGSSGGVDQNAEVRLPEDLRSASQTPAPEENDEPALCESGQLEVLPVTDQESYAPGESPQLSLTIENTGDESCVADLGTAGMQFEVSSGSDQVWRSADCQTNPENLAIELKAGQTLETEAIDWDRTRSSAETCDISRDEVAAGGASYHLKVAAAGVKGAGTAQFLLY